MSNFFAEIGKRVLPDIAILKSHNVTVASDDFGGKTICL